jgi:uncharacterized RDD family membrane protein YckC
MDRVFASLRLRFLAFLLDYLVISAYLVLLVVMGVLIRSSPFSDAFGALFANPLSAEATAFVLLVVPVILYFALFESSMWQASPGKRKMGLQVTNEHGAPLTLPWSLVRSALKFIPWELTHLCLWNIPGWPLNATTVPPLILAGLVMVWVIAAAYAISLMVSKTHQSLYDRIAGAYVVEAHAEDEQH